MKIPEPSTRKRFFRKNGSILPFAGLSLACFTLAVGLVYLMLYNAETITNLGFIGQMYYLILLPIALCVSGFLFGVMRSYATWKGEILNGILELGGPVVVFLLVVLIGLFCVGEPTPFSITVYPHGPGGEQDRIENLDGILFLDIEQNRRQEPIDSQGKAVFAEIPNNFRGKKAWISLQSDRYEIIKPGLQISLHQSAIYLGVQARTVFLSGLVLNHARQPVADATVRFIGQSMVSAPDGSFQFSIRPAASKQRESRLTVNASGFSVWSEYVIAGGNPVTVLLENAP